MKIIIVGASSGIGREMALHYASQGHQVGITGRRKELLQEVKNLFPQNIYTSCFDVTDGNASSYLQELIGHLQEIDLLIYNAGIGEPSEHLVQEAELNTTKTNVLAFVNVMCFAFNFFVEQGYGQFAVTSSIAALRGNSWTPAYSASKAFMSNYAEGLNIKAARLKKAIVVTDIKPGFIKTKMAKGPGQFWVASPQKAAKQIIAAIDKKKRVAYITRRWWLIAQVLKHLPYAVYRRIA